MQRKRPCSHSRSEVISSCIHSSWKCDSHTGKSQTGHNFSFDMLLPTGVAPGVASLSFKVAFATLCHPGRSAPDLNKF